MDMISELDGELAPVNTALFDELCDLNRFLKALHVDWPVTIQTFFDNERAREVAEQIVEDHLKKYNDALGQYEKAEIEFEKTPENEKSDEQKRYEANSLRSLYEALEIAQAEHVAAKNRLDEAEPSEYVVDNRALVRLAVFHDKMMDEINSRTVLEEKGICRITPPFRGTKDCIHFCFLETDASAISVARERLGKFLPVENEPVSCAKDASELFSIHEKSGDLGAELTQPSSAPGRGAISPELVYSSAARAVTWNKTTTALSPAQNVAFGVLYSAWKDGVPDVHNTELLEKISQCESDTREPSYPARIQDVFRGCSLWKTLIKPGAKRGWWRLKP